MSWYSPYRGRSDPKQPDEEDIVIDHAIERSYDLAIHSLGDEIHAEDVALAVTKRCYDVWQPARRLILKPHKSPQNRATKIDLATYDLMEKYKKKWIDEDYRPLPAQFPDRWYLEAIVEYGLLRQPMFSGVGIGTLLFNYKNTEVQRVLERLDVRLVNTHANYKDGDFRQKKKFIVDYLKPRGGKAKRCISRFLTLQSGTHQNEPKRFVPRANSDQSYQFVRDTLAHLTPLQPDCPFPHEFYDGSFDLFQKDLELYIKRHDPYKTADGFDRGVKHVLIHPDCWMPIYKKLHFEDPERKLTMPDYSSNLRVNLASSKPLNRSAMGMSAELKSRIGRRAEEWDRERKNFAAESISILVNDEMRHSLSINGRERRSADLPLDHGDSFIELHGVSEQGDSMLLRTLFVPWNRYEIGIGTTISYVTRLAGGGKLRLVIKYDKTPLGDPIAAVAKATYVPDLSPAAWVNGLSESQKGKRVWSRAIAGTALVGLIVAAASFLILRFSSGVWKVEQPSTRSSSSEIPNPSESNHLHIAVGSTTKPSFATSDPLRVARTKRVTRRAGNTVPSLGEQAKLSRIQQDSSKRVDARSQERSQKTARSFPSRFLRSVGKTLKRGVEKANQLLSSTSQEASPPLSESASSGAIWPAVGAQASAQAFSSLASSRANLTASADAAPIVFVTDTSSRPVPSAILLFKLPGSSNDQLRKIALGEFGVITDGEGRFCECGGSSSLKPGTYDLIVVKEGFETSTTKGVQISDRLNRTIKITLERLPETEPYTSAGRRFQRTNQ
jgi:hypothetical protein